MAVLGFRWRQLKQGLLWGSVAVLLFAVVPPSEEPPDVTIIPGILRGKTVVLDPGHGGRDSGIQRHGVLEKNINLQISQIMAELLINEGAQVIMTRTDDQAFYDYGPQGKLGDLTKRVDDINNSHPDVFVSIHVNGSPGSRWAGAQVFYSETRPENLKAAQQMQKVLRNFPSGNKRQQQRNRDIIILKQSTAPGVLVEVGFLTNPSEFQLLQTAEYQRKLAEAMMTGLQAYFSLPE